MTEEQPSSNEFKRLSELEDGEIVIIPKGHYILKIHGYEIDGTGFCYLSTPHFAEVKTLDRTKYLRQWEFDPVTKKYSPTNIYLLPLELLSYPSLQRVTSDVFLSLFNSN